VPGLGLRLERRVDGQDRGAAAHRRPQIATRISNGFSCLGQSII
jgi:hypothetical protein